MPLPAPPAPSVFSLALGKERINPAYAFLDLRGFDSPAAADAAPMEANHTNTSTYLQVSVVV